MNVKKLICLILSVALVISSIPALAIDINGNTGGVGTGPVGSGAADWNWSTDARGRTGYR